MTAPAWNILGCWRSIEIDEISYGELPSFSRCLRTSVGRSFDARSGNALRPLMGEQTLVHGERAS
eukprot:10022825-Lingulodinium_polyedra.AAC.1